MSTPRSNKKEKVESRIENEEDLSYLEAKLPPIRLRQDEKKSVRLTKAEIEEMKQDEEVVLSEPS